MNEEIAIERMKEDVLQKMGHTLDSPTDFDYLALQIKNATGEDISSTTLKRIFGYIPSQSSPRRSSLSIMARYLGYAGWSGYVESTRVVSGFISKKVVMSNKLHEGDMVQVEWRPDRRLALVALGGERFAVAHCENSRLRMGDEMEIMMFILNQPLQVKNVIRDGENIGHYTAGMDGGLTRVAVSR